MTFVTFLPPGGGLGGLFAQQPERYRACMEIGRNLMAGPSELQTGERELIAAFVSALNACSFCLGTHGSIARAFGWDPQVIEALVEDTASAPLPEKLLPIMQLVRKLTLQPARLTQADADAVIAAGWNEQTLSDVVAISAYYAMANRLASGHGIEALSEKDNEAIGKHIVEQGYPDVDSLPRPSGDT